MLSVRQLKDIVNCEYIACTDCSFREVCGISTNSHSKIAATAMRYVDLLNESELAMLMMNRAIADENLENITKARKWITAVCEKIARLRKESEVEHDDKT